MNAPIAQGWVNNKRLSGPIITAKMPVLQPDLMADSEQSPLKPIKKGFRGQSSIF
jgi:hypothetical protein